MPPKVVIQVARISCFGWAAVFMVMNSSDMKMSKKVRIPVKFGGKDNK